VGPLVHHRFDGEHHPGREQRPFAGRSEIRDLRFFVHHGTDAVTDHLPNHAEATPFNPRLDGVTDVKEAVSINRPGDPLVETLLGDREK